jgi:hypothetical protein
LDLEVREVLKGYHVGVDLTVVIPGETVLQLADYNVGDEFILCAIYWRFMRCGPYTVTNAGGCFQRLGDNRWANLSSSPTREALVVPLEDIAAAATRCRPDVVLESAALAVIGTIDEITSYRDPGGALVEVIRAKVSDVIKGAPGTEFVAFRAVLKNGDELAWNTQVPPFTAGDEWLVFLARDEAGFYVLDGTNGLFRVQGDSLIQADRVLLPVTTDSFILTLKQQGTLR